MFKRLRDNMSASELYQFVVLGMLFILDMSVFFMSGALHEGITGALIGACIGIAGNMALKEK